MESGLKDNRQIKFRVNETEYDYLAAIAQQAGLSMAQLSKNEVLGIRYKQPKMDLEQTKILARELRYYSNNLNQIAKQVNANDAYLLMTQQQEIVRQLEEIRKGVRDVWEQLSR